MYTDETLLDKFSLDLDEEGMLSDDISDDDSEDFDDIDETDE